MNKTIGNIPVEELRIHQIDEPKLKGNLDVNGLPAPVPYSEKTTEVAESMNLGPVIGPDKTALHLDEYTLRALSSMRTQLRIQELAITAIDNMVPSDNSHNSMETQFRRASLHLCNAIACINSALEAYERDKDTNN